MVQTIYLNNFKVFVIEMFSWIFRLAMERIKFVFYYISNHGQAYPKATQKLINYPLKEKETSFLYMCTVCTINFVCVK